MHFAYRWWPRRADRSGSNFPRRQKIVNEHEASVMALIRIVRAQLSLFKTAASLVIIKQPRGQRTPDKC